MVQLHESERNDFHIKKLRMVLQIAILALIVATIAVIAKEASPLQAAAKPSISLEQCANQGSTCDSSNPSNWVTGNLGANNSEYVEGDAVPYRAVLSNLSVGATYKINIEWDTTLSGRHALDYLTSFNFSEATAHPYSYLLTNTGNTILGPAQFSISDDQIDEGGLFSCGAPNTTLSIGATVLCTAPYVTTSGNVADEQVTNRAFGVGGGVSTPTAVLTIPYVAPETTTTVGTTGTTIPESTTTIPESTTTTVPVTTSTVPVTTTTLSPVELQVVVPEVPTGGEDVFDVLFVEALPDAGLGVGFMSLIAGIVLLLGIGVTSMSITRGNRRIKNGDSK
jgi:hypothetical protein